MIGFVYKTTNLLNGKVYIGQKMYRRGVKDNPIPSYLGSGSRLKVVIKKFGKEKFKRDILCWCESREDMDKKEIFYIKKYNSTNIKYGYNITSGGQLKVPYEIYAKTGCENPNYGNYWTDEQKLKASNATKGKYVGEKNPNFGNRWSEEQRKKASERMIGKLTNSKNPNSKKIMCLDDGIIFLSIKELAESFGITYNSLYIALKKNNGIYRGKTYKRI